MTRRTATKRDYVRVLAVGSTLVGLGLTGWWVWGQCTCAATCPRRCPDVRRLEQRIICEDDARRRYVVEVFVNSRWVTSHSGAYEVWEDREYWLKIGDYYQPINVVEVLGGFTFVSHGRIMTLRRLNEPMRLPSFLRLPAWRSWPRLVAGQGLR